MSKVRQVISLFFNYNYPEKVRDTIFSWLLDQDKKNEKDAALQEIWSNLEVRADASIEKSFLETQQKIAAQPANTHKTPKFLGTKQFGFRFFIRASMWILISMLPLLCYLLFISPNNTNIAPPEPVELIECFVPYGKTQVIRLSDSSQITLFAGSLLIYPKEFRNKVRHVYLNGEANFNVTKTNQSFIVKTSDMDINVLGTVFNVSSYPENESVSTTLSSGQVQITLHHQHTTPILMMPNEQLSYNRVSGAIVLKPIDATQILTQNETSLLFTSTSLANLVKVIERKYGVKVHLNTNRFNTERVTAKFVHGEDLNESLSVIQELIPGLRYQIKESEVFIY